MLKSHRVIFSNSKLVQSFVFLTLFSISTQTAWSDEVKSKYGSLAVPLSQSHEYFKKNSAPQFWTLIPYYLPQMDDSACSVATVAMIVNAARSGKKQTAKDELATQKELLKKVKSPSWKGPMGYATRGVPLDELGTVLESSLKAYGVQPLQVEVIHTDPNNEQTKKKLHETLLEFEKSNNLYIAANFNQGSYTSDSNVGHIAPVGAYDSEKKQVLILDPDRQWYEPYWISEEIFLKGMGTIDERQSGKHRGYVKIKLPEHQ